MLKKKYTRMHIIISMPTYFHLRLCVIAFCHGTQLHYACLCTVID